MTLKDGSTEFYFFDMEDFTLLKKISGRLLRGKMAEVSNYYRDYRLVDGIRFPFVIDATIDGQPYNSSQFESIELNIPVDPAIFAMPEN